MTVVRLSYDHGEHKAGDVVDLDHTTAVELIAYGRALPAEPQTSRKSASKTPADKE